MEALLEAALRLSAPLLLAALGELVIERAGLINVGIEGTLLTGAFAGFVVAVASGSPLAGVAAAAAAGVAVGCLFAAFTVLGRVDQIVVGTAVNLIALGATGAAARALYGGAPPSAPTFGPIGSGPLAELPWVGSLFFAQTAFVHAGWLACLVIAFAFARTRAGLRLRAVGESARAADAEGVSVPATRFAAVLIGSALAGSFRRKKKVPSTQSPPSTTSTLGVEARMSSMMVLTRA